MALAHIKPWWQRIGCIRQPDIQTGEEAAMADEIKELREALATGEDAARAALAYDNAIRGCADDPDAMSSYCTAEGDTLDTLYADWLDKARAVLDK